MSGTDSKNNLVVKSRHSIPDQAIVNKVYKVANQERKKRNYQDPISFDAGTCFDRVISEQWN